MADVFPSGDLPGRLARRLDGEGPLGVAVSGGGDSVALLYALAEWGRRPLHVFCVDHGINPASAGWTETVAGHAVQVKAAFTPLHWRGAKPAHGLSAAARTARHALLAEAAREAGVRVLCLAHTQDDIAEAGWMRGQGSNVTAPAEWGPSPAWPQGRGVFLFRPLLGQSRDSLRRYLVGRGIDWIEDPANVHPQSLRAQARLADKPAPTPVEALKLSGQEVADLLDGQWADLGLIALRQSVFTALPPATARRVLAAAAVCAGGGDRLPRGDSIDALLATLGEGRPHTLCGARIWSADDRICAVREAGDIGRRDTTGLDVSAGVEALWDGRFALRTVSDGTVWASGQVRARLDEGDRARLARLPASVRRILPVLDQNFPAAALSKARLLGQTMEMGVNCVNWVVPRFVAACGAVDRESLIGLDLAEPPWNRVAKPQTLTI